MNKNQLLFSIFLLCSFTLTAQKFAAIGDYGVDNSNELDVSILVKSWNPDFIITAGDNNYTNGEATTIDPNIGKYYQEFIGNYMGTYGPGSTVNKFFPSPGNHDYYTAGALPYYNYFTLPGNERYYDFVEGDVHFFSINSNSDEPDGNTQSGIQAQWLQNGLANSTAQWKVVFFHHASYSSGSHGSNSTLQWPFDQWGATAVITGHDHHYERLNVNGVLYFVNGTGGRGLYGYSEADILPQTEFIYNNYGAMLIEATSTSINFQWWEVGGNLIDEITIEDCAIAKTSNFPSNTLTHSGTGSSSVTALMPAGSEDVYFAISEADAILNGNPNRRYMDKVTVSYINGNGTTITHGTINGNTSSSIHGITLSGEIQSVTVTLEDGYDGNYSNGGGLSISLSEINYCGSGNGCPDSDNDGVCDDVDQCPGQNDNLIGTACDDGDVCTNGETYDNSCACSGGQFNDSDGDGVCDALDICQGGNDNEDSDDDGIPDFCDSFDCTNEITNSFVPNPLYHQGSGSTTSGITFPAGSTDVSFDITSLGSKTNGKPSNRYIDEVTITYVDGSGTTQTDGVYYGNIQSSVAINISGLVQSVTIALSDDYDGDTGSNVISVDMSDAISCLPANNNLVINPNGSGIGSNPFSRVSTGSNPIKYKEAYGNSIGFYPNPFFNQISILWLDDKTTIEMIRVFDFRGKEIKSIKNHQLNNSCTLKFDQINNGVYFIQILDSNKHLHTKKVIKQ